MMKLAVLVSFLLVHDFFGRALGFWGSWKREASESTLIVPITATNGKYSVNVNMSSAFNLQLVFSTSTGWTVVAGAACYSCNGAPVYNLSQSPTGRTYNSGLTSPIAYDPTGASNDLGEQVIKDDCTLHVSNSPGWYYPNQTSQSRFFLVPQRSAVRLPALTLVLNGQTVVTTNQSSSVFSKHCSGIVGLGTNKKIGRFNDSLFGGFLSGNPSMSNMTVGMALKPLNNPQDGDDLGVAHWLTPDPTAYEDPVAYKNVISGGNATNGSDWAITMDDWVFSTNGKKVAGASGNSITSMDPFFPNLYFPSNVVQPITNSIPGASLTQEADPEIAANVWTLPCDTSASLSLTFGTQTFVLDSPVLIINNNNGTCFFAIRSWRDPARVDYLLGAKFMSSVYIIMSTSALANSSSSDSIGIARRTLPQTSHGLSAGGIAGISVGSSVFVALLIMALLFFYFRMRPRKSPAESIKSFSQPPGSPGSIPFKPGASPLSAGFPHTPLSNQGVSQPHEAPQPASTFPAGPVSVSIERNPRPAPSG